jgi:hypothetical protein
VTSEPLPRSVAAPLVARTIEIPDPGPLVDLLPGTPYDVSWVRQTRARDAGRPRQAAIRHRSDVR